MRPQLAHIYIAALLAAGLWLYSIQGAEPSLIEVVESMPCKLSDIQGKHLTCAAE